MVCIVHAVSYPSNTSILVVPLYPILMPYRIERFPRSRSKRDANGENPQLAKGHNAICKIFEIHIDGSSGLTSLVRRRFSRGVVLAIGLNARPRPAGQLRSPQRGVSFLTWCRLVSCNVYARGSPHFIHGLS